MNDSSKQLNAPGRVLERPRHSRIWYVALYAVVIAFLLLIILIIWIVHRATQKLTINRATTFVTGPLRPDGTINYAAALNRIAGRGVTPQNNAAIPLLRIFGANKDTLGSHWRRIEKRMGAKIGGPSGPRFSDRPSRNALLKKLPNPSAPNPRGSQRPSVDGFPWCAIHPWSRQQYPSLARYLRSQRAALAAIQRAVQRSRYFVPALEHGEPSRDLTEAKTGPLALYRKAANALLEHAMLMVSERHYRRATGDFVAVRRWGALISRQPDLMCDLQGALYNTMTSTAWIDMALEQPRRKTLFRLLLRQRWAKVRDMRLAFNIGERLRVLSDAQNLRTGDLVAVGRPVSFGPPGGLVDWNWVFRHFNKLYDGLDFAAGSRTYDLSIRRFAPTARSFFASDRKFRRERMHTPTAIACHFLAVLDLMPSPFRPAFVYFRSSTADHFAKIAMALDLYRADHHAFPATLAALCPKYLPRIGLDTFDGKPPMYVRTSKGYTLRSAGPFGHLMRRPRRAIASDLLICFPPLTKTELQRLAAGKTVDGLRKLAGRDYYGLKR